MTTSYLRNASAFEEREPQDSPGALGPRQHLSDDGHLLAYVARHARASGVSHGRHPSLAGWCQVGVNEPRHQAGTLLYLQRFTCKSLENESGGTRIRTGDTMIFSHRSYVLLRTTL